VSEIYAMHSTQDVWTVWQTSFSSWNHGSSMENLEFLFPTKNS